MLVVLLNATSTTVSSFKYSRLHKQSTAGLKQIKKTQLIRLEFCISRTGNYRVYNL